MSLGFIQWVYVVFVMVHTCFKTIDYMRYADTSLELMVYGIFVFLYSSGMAYLGYYLFLELVYENH